MIRMKHILTAVALSFLLVSSQAQELAQSELPQNFNTPTANLVTGGQPSKAELERLKSAGVTKVINLRGPDEEAPFDEKSEAERLGLEYISLPISGAPDVTSENARELHKLLQGDEQVFLHCASGNRAGALLAIRAHEIQGKPVEDSLELGRAAGLTSLEERVKSVLDN